MKRSIHVRFFVTLLLLLSLMSPVAVLAADGKKHFSQGMKHEVAEEWDKAAEEFALAVADNPKNPEYRLHLVRALFNASQLFMRKGTTAARERDYEGAYVAFRRAYAFDPTNELAKSEMDRMVRMQKAVNEGNGTSNGTNGTNGLTLVPTGYVRPPAPPMQIPQKLEKLRDLPFPSGVELKFIIKELARDLDLNVLFDSESFRGGERKTVIDLKNVTSARALDYVFLQEGLFFQKVGPRTIIVANQTQRQKFQQLVLRTFYLANAAPKDIVKVVQTAIPAQPGRSQTIVLQDEATNSVTIRDTEENIRLIGKLISSLDKDRAEVVMDVAIYEISKNDLLKLGNQIGGIDATSTNQLNNLGGINAGTVVFGGNFGATLATAIASGILIPNTVLSAFQSKGNTKLIASTQIHAFNNEDSSARIGQRVPVQSAQFVTGGTNNNNGGIVSNVINYEQVGLTLKFKPIVFPNQDVQVAMEIESKDVTTTSNPLVPGFTERTIKGTARIQNNKTLLLASVAQGAERNGRQGLPFLGGLPIIGRLFSTPTRDNSQVDIVISVTPRVIRAPAILPEDEVERPTGSLAVPTSGLLEAMIMEEEQEELLAAARRMPTTAVIQLPDAPPVYVKTDVTAVVPAETSKPAAAPLLDIKPIDTGVKTLQLTPTSAPSTPVETTEVKSLSPEPELQQSSTAPGLQIGFGTELPEMKAGEKLRIPVTIQGSSAFRSAVMGLKFDDKKVAVRTVTFGDVFGTSANAAATPFLNQNGKMYVSLTAKDADALANGTLAFIEIEALASGRPVIEFDRDVLNLLTADGKNFAIRF